MLWVQLIRGAWLSLQTAMLATFCTGCFGQGEDAYAEAAISPDGKYFAKSTGFGATIYAVQTGKVRMELKEAAASRLHFSPDSRYLTSGNPDELMLWDLTTGKPLVTWKGKNRWSFRVAFTRDSSLLAASDDNSLRVWETATQKLIVTIPQPFETDSLAFSPDGKFVAVGGTETKAKEPRFHEIKVWEIPGGKLHTVLQGPYCSVRSLAFSPDGNSLAVGLSIQSCRLWDLRTKKELWKQQVGNASHGRITFSQDGKQVIAGGYQSVCLLDVVEGTVLKQYNLPGSRITSFTALARPGHLLVASNQGVRALDLASGQQQVLFPK